jgi:superfamily I DNA/RNA helicase
VTSYRYLALQREAIDEIVSNRLLQSADFEAGERLARLLSGDADDISEISPRLDMRTGKSNSGRIITCNECDSKVYVVFDLEQSGLFSSEQPDSEAVVVMQKVLRFCVKYWDQRVLNPAEMIFPSYAKAIVFPFPISQKTRFRVSIDLNPLVERLAPRGKAERYVLVYKAGRDDSQGPAETPSFTVFRKFVDDAADLEGASKSPSRAEAHISAFRNVSIGAPPGRLDIHQGYDAWMRVLTTEQRRFVETPLTAPLRIEGPAGTGKTLCLALKAVHDLRESHEHGEENATLFVTHSEASRRSITAVLESMDAGQFIDGSHPKQYLKVVTLQGLCADILRQDISETELLDPDAYDAKQLQLLYVEAALAGAKREIATYQRFMSDSFHSFVTQEAEWAVVQMLQHEIAVVIKGRANEQFEAYKRVPPIRHGLPMSNEGDKAFVWRVFELYREQLISSAQFDTDDVILSALGQLATPIWRRRRAREGYDNLFIDETHLFNMNELSLFHHLTKRDDRFQIAFAVDRSQAIGDRGWVEDVDLETLVPTHITAEVLPKSRMSSVFRSSPEIVNLAFSVTSSGASLFTNFDNPLLMANSNLSFEEERMCAPPSYVEFDDDAGLVEGAFEFADHIMHEMTSTRGDVAIIAFSDELFRAIESKALESNKPVEVLKERGNVEVVKRARQSGRFVVSMPDYVGGLEFDGVVLVGVDQGRVPPTGPTSNESRAFLNFAAHNRLYVAITRARYRVVITGVRSRGISDILSPAISNGSLAIAGK